MVRGHHAGAVDEAITATLNWPIYRHEAEPAAARSGLPFSAGEAMAFQSILGTVQLREELVAGIRARSQRTSEPASALKMVYRGAAGSSRRRHVGRGHSGDAVFRRACGSTPQAPRAPDRDRLILSKGHCTGALIRDLGGERASFPLEALRDLYEAAVDAERPS